MTGDKRPKMSKLARTVEFCEDGLKSEPRIKGKDKKQQRKLARRVQDTWVDLTIL